MINRVKKVINRSGKNYCNICQQKRILVDHHICGRDIPNYNHPSNRADICSNCHADVHYGKIIIEGWFTTSNGKELLWHYKEEESFSGRDAKPHIIGFQDGIHNHIPIVT